VLYLDSNPIEVLHPAEWTIPVVFSSPHSGNLYPSHFVKQSTLDMQTLRQSEDYKVDELFAAATEIGAPLLKAKFPRAYCDPNREAFELDPDMFDDILPDHVNSKSPRVSAGIGTIPKIVTAGTLIHEKQISYQDAKDRLDSCYFPYHLALQTLLKQCLDKFNFALLIDCHSMPGTDISGAPNFALSDIVLGDRFGRSCPQVYSTFFRTEFQALGYSVTYNTPYAGGYITERYANHGQHIYALQIEINRNLYMEQASVTATAGITRLSNNIHALLHRLSVNFPTLII